jgi:hypothetical protein
MSKKVILGLMLSDILLIAFIPYTLAHDLSSYNLSDYVTPYDNEVIKLAETIGLNPFLSYPLDNTGNAYYWVSENIRYMQDEQRWGARDYWQLPSTTIRLGTGDCEDQAILLTSLLRALKLPRENVRLVIGPTERGTYHAWVEIEIPLPIYGLETVTTHALELLENKKVAISIGEVSYNKSITSAAIAEMKTRGLSHRGGWIPLDTTAKLFGLPIPFSWWLTYGYNVYTLLGCRVTPEQTFQDKARIWEENKELGTGGSISFEIPCLSGDHILGVAKARDAWKEQILNVQPVSGWYNIRFGPCSIGAGETIRFEWAADRSVSVYILNQADWSNWVGIGTPPSRRNEKMAQEGFLEYTAKYSDNFYVVVCHWQSFVIYTYTIKRVWQETGCNIQVSISDPQGISITSIFITQREVEKRFDFTAAKSGVYKVVLKNVGEFAPIYVRLEEFSTSLSPEIAGISENLALAEQEYVDKIARSVEENTGSDDLGFIWGSPLTIMIFSTSVIIVLAILLILKKRNKLGFLKNRLHNAIKTKLRVNGESMCCVLL